MQELEVVDIVKEWQDDAGNRVNALHAILGTIKAHLVIRESHLFSTQAETKTQTLKEWQQADITPIGELDFRWYNAEWKTEQKETL